MYMQACRMAGFVPLLAQGVCDTRDDATRNQNQDTTVPCSVACCRVPIRTPGPHFPPWVCEELCWEPCSPISREEYQRIAMLARHTLEKYARITPDELRTRGKVTSYEPRISLHGEMSFDEPGITWAYCFVWGGKEEEPASSDIVCKHDGESSELLHIQMSGGRCHMWGFFPGDPVAYELRPEPTGRLSYIQFVPPDEPQRTICVLADEEENPIDAQVQYDEKILPVIEEAFHEVFHAHERPCPTCGQKTLTAISNYLGKVLLECEHCHGQCWVYASGKVTIVPG